jgi:hypothetical protein
MNKIYEKLFKINQEEISGRFPEMPSPYPRIYWTWLAVFMTTLVPHTLIERHINKEPLFYPTYKVEKSSEKVVDKN